MHLHLLAVALAEMRSARRLVRTWLFFFLASAMGLVTYVYYGVIHAFGSGHVVTTGMIVSPKMLSVILAGSMIFVLQVCLVFLAFDVRARDQRDRIHEVLDSRPVSNLEVIIGRTLGLTVLVWIPILAIAAVILALGALAVELGWWISDVEPVSFAAMALVDVPVSLLQWCALIVLLSVTLRNRLVVAIAGLALAGLFSWAVTATPLYLTPIFGFGPNLLPSDLVPVFLDGTAVAQRLASLAISAGLLVVAAVMYPRLDGTSRSLRLATGAALVGAGAAGLAGIGMSAAGDLSTREQWANVHRSLADQPRADVEHLTASVIIEPGDYLRLDVDLKLRPASGAANDLVFSFNPGMDIETLRLDGKEVDFSHESGLLTVRPDSPLEGTLTLSLAAAGVPDGRFAYLDSAVDAGRVSGNEASIAQLGTQASLFDGDYVALMPGVRWLPVPGSNYGDDDPSRGRDFFTADIEVQAPPGWTVAGPGERREVEGSQRVRFRPRAPVPAVALFAAPFERRTIGAGGVLFELLIHPAHSDNLDFFADATDALTLRLEEMFHAAEEDGLPYPYDALTVVEIPSRLRGYGGGWRLDTVLAQPGMLLLREFSLPIARFDLIDTEELKDQEGGVAAAKIDMLARSLANDFAGGNVFPGAARNFLRFQTGATGPGAVAMDFVLDSLANQVLTGRPGYFSAYRIVADFQYAAPAAATIIFGGQAQSVSDAVYRAATSRPSVWDRALAEPLSQLDVDTDPERALNALMLKATSIANVLHDGLGPVRSAALLAELRDRFTGQNFTAEDLVQVAADLAIDLDGLLGAWLDETHLPGFLPSGAQVQRLTDDADGSPRYQVLVHVRNDEPAPGLFRMVCITEERTSSTEPIRVAANASVEVGMITSSPPTNLALHPYLSLNRQRVTLPLPEVDAKEATDLEPFDGSRPSDWRPPTSAGLIVDDLDPGFAIDSDNEEQVDAGFLAGLAGIHTEYDQGLPLFNPPFHMGGPGWLRQVSNRGWGKYRRTTARAAGNGDSRAIFSATLPSTGTWRLDYHLPVDPTARGPFVDRQGQYDTKLVIGEREQPVEFDASIAGRGWNHLGDFEVDTPDVRFVVSNLVGSGSVIYADAIRWTPVSTE
ncbi:MAG: hypothetical protein OXI90_06980 [Gammaproteobacteria bacterium]|nr:hypothetical protein [Gammaproteobacteria bacterium]